MAVYDIPEYDIPASLLTALTSLPQNPMVPDSPMGAYTDSIYEATEAQLRADYLRKYADILQLLGYIDPQSGKIIKGRLETDADRQRAGFWRNAQLAGIEAINQAQREGNFFSGYHPVRKARMEQPYWQGITDINTSLPGQMSQQLTDAERAYEEYVLARNLALAEAAARAAEAARDSGGGGGGGTTTSSDSIGMVGAGAPWWGATGPSSPVGPLSPFWGRTGGGYNPGVSRPAPRPPTTTTNVPVKTGPGSMRAQ